MGAAQSRGTSSRVSAESESLKISFSYLVNSIDASSLLPDAFSSNLISDRQRTDCVNQLNSYKKADKFLGHLYREVIGDPNKFHTFVQLLDRSGQAELASRLRGEENNTYYIPMKPYFKGYCSAINVI